MRDHENHGRQLAGQLVLHAGAISEEFSDLAAQSQPHHLRLLQLATSIALLIKAAVELEKSGDT